MPERLRAQSTNTNTIAFEWSVIPTNLSLMAVDTTNAVFVTITNYALFTNLMVLGDFASQTNIPFLDDGNQPDLTQGDGTFTGMIITPTNGPRTETLTLYMTGDPLPTEPPPDPPVGPSSETNTVDYRIVLTPGNDHFRNAWKFANAGGTFTSSNNFATLEIGEPTHAGVASAAASVWWYWFPSDNTNVLVDLAGTTFDAILAVYSGTTVSNLTPLVSATNDIVNNLRAHVNFDAQVGRTYRIAVASPEPDLWGRLRIRLVPGALADTNGPIVSITSPASQSSILTSNLNVAGTVKELYANESGVSNVLLQVNNDTNIIVATGTANWNALVSLPPGTNLIRAYATDIAGNRGRPASVVVRYLNPPNDLFSMATDLDETGDVTTQSTSYATKEPGEPFHAGNEGGKSVWFRFRAPYTGELDLDTLGSSFDTVLAVYVGNGVDSLTELARSDDYVAGSSYSALTVPIVANQVYYIAVDGVGGAAGSMTLTHSFFVVGTFYSLYISPPPLGGVVLPSETLYPPGSIVTLWAIPDRNYTFVRWLTTSGAAFSSANPVTLTINQNYSLQAEFKVVNYTETFRSGGLTGTLPWVTGGAAPWTVTTLEGQSVARSGLITDSQSSSLVLSTNLYAGTGAFDFHVSSEEGWDWLEFYLNGTRMSRWSGEVPWQTYRFSIPYGANTLEWRYVKDKNFSAGLDAAFIDNIYVTVERPATTNAQPTLYLTELPNARVQLGLVGQANTTYVIQTSTNLTAWTPVFTNTVPEVAFQWVDPQPVTAARKYYRAVAP